MIKEIDYVNAKHVHRIGLPVGASLLISLTIGITKTNAHPAVAIGAAHVVASHMVATHMVATHMVAGHMVAGHAAAAAGAHATIGEGLAGHTTIPHLAALNGAGAAESEFGVSQAMASQSVFAHGMITHGFTSTVIPVHLTCHGSMLTGATHSPGFMLGGSLGSSSHGSWGTSMHAWGAGSTPRNGSTLTGHVSQTFDPPASGHMPVSSDPPAAGHITMSSNSPFTGHVSMLSNPSVTNTPVTSTPAISTYVSPSTSQQFAQQGYGVYSIPSPGSRLNYYGSAYNTRFNTYPPKTLSEYSPTYGGYSPYPGASTYGTYNSGDLFSGPGGYLPFNASSNGISTFSYGGTSSIRLGGTSFAAVDPPASSISSVSSVSTVELNYAGLPGYGIVNRFSAGFGGFNVPRSAAISYSRYLSNPGLGVYTGQAGSSIYPAYGAAAYSPAVPSSFTSPLISTRFGPVGTFSGSSLSSSVSATSYSPTFTNSYMSSAAESRLFPTATNNYGFGDTVFSTNTPIAASQFNPFASAYAAALPNTASGDYINSFTAFGLYNSL